ncbi:unnamed protein product [Callosobruchus maculatus]|uniref:Uncharacterized protein n=1 Tax=Callosobruchus maculatus TaxID=64391 RepID=A0A653BQM9_CALMS|nr:unnamed protein product [Callosobruchus maculatus]
MLLWTVMMLLMMRMTRKLGIARKIFTKQRKI